MAKIIGEPFDKYVADQINARQKAHGSGVDGNPRTSEYLSYLNSNSSWVKLASGIFMSNERSAEEKLKPGYIGKAFAKRHILFSGMSNLPKGETTIQQRGTSPDLSKNIADNLWGMYDVNATNNSSDFGLTPMPGITSAEVKSLNRGSIKRATINIKCYSPEQFKIIDLLYLRIGYTVFLEWGNTLYLESESKLETMGYTLIEDEDGFFADSIAKTSYSSFLPKIAQTRIAKNGNYDGLLAKVVNFSWTFAQDGSYDIELQLISLGDVVESLKTNISPPYEDITFITQAYSLYSEEDSEDDKNIPPSPTNNVISAYLFMQKLFLDKENNDESGYDKDERIAKREITCKINGDDIILGGIFVKPPSDKVLKLEPIIDRKYHDSEAQAQAYVESFAPNATKTTHVTNDLDTDQYSIKSFRDQFYTIIKVHPQINIETSQKDKDVAYLNYNNGEDAEINDSGFYMRFGHLLDFIKLSVIPKISGSGEGGNKIPLVKIDNNKWSNKMYTLPYQISLDPRVCIVNGVELINHKDYFPQLIDWKNPENFTGKDIDGFAWTMNIYISHDQILNSLNSNVDDKGNLSLFDFLSSICTALNKAMGGINNLEPILDEETNTIHIIDGSYAPKRTKPDYGLELFGYNPGHKSSNFVRNTSIKTEITNDFATMATIGSTAGGYVKGTENTMFSKWNQGLIDRFKGKFDPPSTVSKNNAEGEEDDVKKTYIQDFWDKRYSPFGYTLQDISGDWGDDGAGLDDEIIDKNIATVSEFFKYAQYVIHQENKKYSSPSNGFIPISLNVTMDGLSGIKIYNEINAVTRFLPSNYPDNLRFIVKGVNHKLQDQDWETSIETMVIAQTDDVTEPLSYQKKKDIIDKIIAEGRAIVVEQAQTSNANNSSSGNSPTPRNTGSGVDAKKAYGKGVKTYGTLGPSGDKTTLSKDALTIDSINTIVANSGATSIIRKRIVEIAASYVGNQEIKNPPQNPGWYDDSYESKFKQLNGPWSKSAPWCAWFCQLVWGEAYTTGNKLVPNADTVPEYASTYKSIWENELKNGKGISPRVFTVETNFSKLNKYVTVAQAKNGTKTIEPGDLVIYSYSHIAIVIKPFYKNGKLTGFSEIGGNTSSKDPRNGGETKYYPSKSLSSVKGFCKVITPLNK